MREIKFRAWDGEQMVSPDYIDREGVAWWKANGMPTFSTKVMQFTGLKDKNGKEIYEGDILYYAGMMNTPYIIGYFNGSFWACYKEQEFPISKPQYCFVIGNIYENPELLQS